MTIPCRYFLAAPRGDLELDPTDLARPFLISPGQAHPFLTLKDYFGVLQQFLLTRDSKNLADALARLDTTLANGLADLKELRIRSEKHGAFYHIASIVPAGLAKEIRLAVTTALAETAKTTLEHEFVLLRQLARRHPAFLPALFRLEKISLQTDSGPVEFCLVLGEWLTGYHEWHLSLNPATGQQQIRIWDYDRGCYFLSQAQSFDLLRRVACILTTYYDRENFRQIYPWHHGAGDFVARVEPDRVSVKLITVRQYEPLLHFGQPERHDRLVAAIQFLLNLSLRIRLDRLDGVGEPAWFPDFAVRAAVAGFFAGLSGGAAGTDDSPGPVRDLLDILRSFEAAEIYQMYESLVEMYAAEDQDDFRLIRTKLVRHAEDLRAALQDFSR